MFKTVAQQVHHAERSDQRERHGHARNHRGGKVPQEQEDDHHHQSDGQHQLKLHIFDRGADGGGPVGENLHLDRLRQRCLQLRQQLLDAVNYADDVGAGLALDVHDHGWRQVHPGGQPVVLGTVDDVGHVAQPHRRAVAIGDHNRFVLVTGKQLIVGADRIRLPHPVDDALGLIHVGLGHGRAQILKAQTIRSQRGRVRLNPDRRLLPAANRNQPHTRKLRDLLRQGSIGEILDLGQGQRIRRKGQRENRSVRRINLVINGRIRQVRG